MGSQIAVRKSVLKLSDAEWQRFAAAMNELKRSGEYDEFTRRHQRAMLHHTPWTSHGETAGSITRNTAHEGPAFLPWHRAFLLEMEQALRQAEASIRRVGPGEPLLTIPYFPWDNLGSKWRSSAMWSSKRLGGNGSSQHGWRIQSGPFKGWRSVLYRAHDKSFVTRSGIIRRFVHEAMPEAAPLDVARYDSAPWDNRNDPGGSYRHAAEQAHDRVHFLIGGDMRAGTSPNDPVFYLHHANVDRLWWEWQQAHGIRSYRPTHGGPAGHNLHSRMMFLHDRPTPASLLDISRIYAYK